MFLKITKIAVITMIIIVTIHPSLHDINNNHTINSSNSKSNNQYDVNLIVIMMMLIVIKTVALN